MNPPRTVTRRLSALIVSVSLAATGVALGGAGETSKGKAEDVLVWGSSSEAAALAVQSAGAEVQAELPIVGGVATSLDPDQVAAVMAEGLQVSADTPLAVAALDESQAPAVDGQLAAINPGDDWDLTAGSGVGVALIDTGVTEVPDLEGRLVHGPDLSGEGTTRDTYGHGTFMAGLIAGDGSMSQTTATRHMGVAPGAHIVSVKIAGADGTTSLSKLLDAIGWVVENGDRHAIRVLNLSVAVPPLSKSYMADPLSAAVEAAWTSGITVVAASGNDGALVSSPGRDPWVVTVGALDTGTDPGHEDDTVPSWSGRGTSPRGVAKPDLLAPGVSVVSLLAPSSTIARENPSSIVDGDYMRGSGTSMATAMTSGAVAVLTEHHAAATPDDYKGALVNSARPVAGEIGSAVDLAAADVVEVDAGGGWWQTHEVAFNGLAMGLDNRMPWAEEWSGTRWAGTRWAGTRWAGTRWVEHEWAGTRWAGTRWAGTRWAGTRWAGTRWADDVWTGTRWAGTRWAGTRWAGTRWAGTRWAGTRWAGTRWADAGFAAAGWTDAGAMDPGR